MLLARGYKRRVIESAFDRVRCLSREETLKKVEKVPTEKTTFVITFDPRLTSVPRTVHKHARTLMMDPHMREIYKEGFQVGFKRHRNIKEFLCRAKLYDTGERVMRTATKGWRKCQKCVTCTRSRNVTKFQSSANRMQYCITEDIGCKDQNIIYIIECRKCPTRPQYVGKSIRCLMNRGREHINAVDKGNFEGSSSGKMYQHFTTNNHSSRDMMIFGIEVVHGDSVITTVRERYWMQKLDTIHRGLNSNLT